MRYLYSITVLVAVGTLLSRILGFGREVVLAEKFGASIESDVFLVAITVPLILFQSIGIGFTNAMIPIQEDIKENSKIKIQFYSSLLTYTLVFSILVTAIGMFFSESVVTLFAPGFNYQETQLTSQLLMITFPMTIFSMITAITSGVLQYNNRFYIVTFGQIPYNSIVIIALLFSHLYGIKGVALGALIASFTLLCIQLPKSIQLGFTLRLSWRINSHLRKFLFILLPISLVTLSQQAGSIVDRYLASNLSNGSIAALNFADRLYLLPFGIIIMAISTVYYPKLVRVIREKPIIEIQKLTNRLIGISFFVMLPLATAMFMLKTEIVSFVYERGNFTLQDVEKTSIAFGYYAIGLVSLSIRELILKINFAIEDNKTPMINSIVMILINIILSVILSHKMGHGGIALGTSLSIIISSLMLIIALKRKKILMFSFLFLSKIIFITIIIIIFSELLIYSEIVNNLIGFGPLAVIITTFSLILIFYIFILIVLRIIRFS